MTNLNERIKQVIDEVENGERDTYIALEPTYLEKEYTDGATEYFIGLDVENTSDLAGGEIDLIVYFPEREHFKEARNKNWMGDLSDEGLEEVLQNINELEDRFDFDVIEMYQDDLGVNFVDYLREDA